MREENADMYFICAYNLEMDREPTVFIATKDHPNYSEFEYTFRHYVPGTKKVAEDLYTYDGADNGTVRVYRIDTDKALQAEHEAWLDSIYIDVE